MLEYPNIWPLFKLAASDANKSAIVEKQGLDKLIQLSSVFAADPTALQEVGGDHEALNQQKL